MVSSPKGFFSSLYDLSFDTFITPRIIRIVYVIWLAGIALWSLTFLVAGFAVQPSFYGEGHVSGWFFLFHLGGAAVIFVVGSISARISLEFVMAVFRIAENTESLRRESDSA
jgi:hypothetical protein